MQPTKITVTRTIKVALPGYQNTDFTVALEFEPQTADPYTETRDAFVHVADILRDELNHLKDCNPDVKATPNTFGL